MPVFSWASVSDGSEPFVVTEGELDRGLVSANAVSVRAVVHRLAQDLSRRWTAAGWAADLLVSTAGTGAMDEPGLILEWLDRRGCSGLG